MLLSATLGGGLDGLLMYNYKIVASLQYTHFDVCSKLQENVSIVQFALLQCLTKAFLRLEITKNENVTK